VTATLVRWVAEPPPREVQEALERLARTPDVVRVAAMPDVHLAEDVCVGTVVATERTLIPAAVGGDIGCGMAAVAFDGEADALTDERAAAAVLTGLSRTIPSLRRAGPAALPDALKQRELSAPGLESLKRRTAALQLGTLGRGNHFVELQGDEEGRLWLMIHSGSRGLGPAIRDHHHERGERLPGGLRAIAADGADGAAYLGDVQWALDYAGASRLRMAEAAAEVVRACLGQHVRMDTWIACAHNLVRREEHDGQCVYVHRKGAISARDGELGVIPGSMGAASYHVEGRGCAAALCSSSHGAGRQMSRGEARRRVSVVELIKQMRGVWFDHRAAEGLRDEAPAAYKDITAVIRAQRELTRVVRRLRPLLSYKGV
jgi:tRNA-splicing ligase RtcB